MTSREGVAARSSYPVRLDEGRWSARELAAELDLALDRSGRQADALAVYDEGRRLLADELGVDPERELQQLYERVLRQDPTLDLPVAPVRTAVASSAPPRNRSRPAGLPSWDAQPDARSPRSRPPRSTGGTWVVHP